MPRLHSRNEILAIAVKKIRKKKASKFNYEQFLKFVPDTLSIVVGLARVTPASLNTDKAQQAKKTLTFGAHSL